MYHQSIFDDGYLLSPGEFILATSNEIFNFDINDFSISLWANPTSTDCSGGTNPIVAKTWDVGTASAGYEVFTESGSWKYKIANGTTNYKITATACNIGWSNVIIIRKNTEWLFYLNGVLKKKPDNQQQLQCI